VKERNGDVIENKWSAFHGRGKSGNVIENKAVKRFKVGMLLKLKVVNR
jgi:hypothetical protein